MVYILAGNECSGKTTVFNMLKRSDELDPETSFIKESHTACCKNKVGRIMYFVAQAIEGRKPTVYDRATVLDDMVYSTITDGKQSPFYNDCRSVLRNRNYKYKIIYLDVSVEVLKKRLLARGDEFIKPEQLMEISESYEEVLRTLPQASIVRIDASGDCNDTYRKVLEVILQNEKSNESR